MFLKTTTLALAGILACQTASAASFSFTGSFDNDYDVQFFDFSVAVDSNVTLKTYSYAGGTMAEGTVVGAGGFDPILAVFDATTGALVGGNDDGSAPDVGVDPVTFSEFDTFLELALLVGNYTVAVSQFDNFAVGDLSDGFTYSAADGNFTGAVGGCSNGIFCDVNADNRTSAWAFDILNVNEATVVNPSTVPLPAGMPLMLAGLGVFAFMQRKTKN